MAHKQLGGHNTVVCGGNTAVLGCYFSHRKNTKKKNARRPYLRWCTYDVNVYKRWAEKIAKVISAPHTHANYTMRRRWSTCTSKPQKTTLRKLNETAAAPQRITRALSLSAVSAQPNQNLPPHEQIVLSVYFPNVLFLSFVFISFLAAYTLCVLSCGERHTQR